jgi:hypothetical protein
MVDIQQLTLQTVYRYDWLPLEDETAVRSYVQKTYEKAVEIAKDWSEDNATEWACRSYLAVKMIHASQLMFKVLAYSEEKNIQLTRKYLMYYALFNSCRALVMTDLFRGWDSNEELRVLCHKKVCRLAGEITGRLSQQRRDETTKIVVNQKKLRELFSYSFPADGLNNKEAEDR